MKIRIDFNTEEKITIADAIDCPLEDDKSEGFEGRFGKMEYDKENNFIEINLETEYIKAYSKIISAVKGMIMSFVSTIELFTDAWLSDIKPIKIKKEEEPNTSSESEDINPFASESDIEHNLKKEAMESEYLYDTDNSEEYEDSEECEDQNNITLDGVIADNLEE